MSVYVVYLPGKCPNCGAGFTDNYIAKCNTCGTQSKRPHDQNLCGCEVCEDARDMALASDAIGLLGKLKGVKSVNEAERARIAREDEAEHKRLGLPLTPSTPIRPMGGSHVVIVNGKVVNDKKICINTNCRKQIDPNARFCPHCGTKQ